VSEKISNFVGIVPAQIQLKEGVPVAEVFDDIYFNTEDGAAETEYVFLLHNQLPQRFENAEQFCIVETGFGSGLNFLVTAHHWLQTAPSDAVLHFHSIEKYPIPLEVLRTLYQQWPQFVELETELLANYPHLLPGRHNLLLFDGRVQLSLWFGDVSQVLAQLPSELRVDAWYLDGFAPAKNPEMWQPALFQQMARLSHAGTTFATFTAAGVVRRGLQAAGFSVQKDKGFGKKRELCFGQWSDGGAIEALSPKKGEKAPWFAPAPAFEAAEKTAIVVGAGLAGATLAYALVEAGYQVTVLEQSDSVASLASGNAAGAIHPLVTADWNLRSQFYLQGFETTLRWLKPWIASGQVEGALNGLLQLAVSPQMAERHQQAVQRVNLPSSFAQWWSPEEIERQWGIQTDYAGLFFPQGGWVVPKTVVETCLNHANITVQTAVQVQDWEFWQENGPFGWQVETSRGLFRASVLAIATGALNERLNQKLGLSIRPVKGQVSTLSNACVQTTLLGSGRVVTHQGYSVFKPDTLVTGATFEAPDLSPLTRPEADQENIAQLQQAVPNAVVEVCEDIQGRVSFRPTTPDHLPIIGAVPDWAGVKRDFLQQNASKMPHQYLMMSYQPGLLVSNGHGPRGLMSVFLAAEEAVRQLHGVSSGLSERSRQAAHPARFTIRQWRRR